MKKIHLILSICALMFTSSLLASSRDITHEFPEINSFKELEGYQKEPDVAQYKNADWNTVIGIAKGISLEEAKKIADEDPEISFFFYTKGAQMVLERADETYFLFQYGDTVFFSGEPWWGSAPGLADGYIKKR